MGDVGIPVAVGVAIGTVLAVLFSTVVQMVFGELFPKNLSIARPEPVARRLALSTSIYLKVFGPVISLFDAASNLLLKALRIEPVHDVEHSASPRDLEHIVAESREVGELPAELSTLLDRVLDFPTRTAEHAMVPRPLVDFVAADTSLSEVRDLMAVGHTRYPVVGTNPDDVVGIVHLHDLLERLDETSLTAADLARPAAIVPTTLPLPAVLERLDTTSDDEMAVVIDEYGGIAGIITVEDIAEEITGEIDDEHDTTSSEPIELTDDGWLARGDTHLDEVSRVIGHEVAEGDYETLSGLVISTSGGLPQVGDSVELPLADATFGVAAPTVTATVTQVRRRVPATVHLVITESGDADE